MKVSWCPKDGCQAATLGLNCDNCERDIAHERHLVVDIDGCVYSLCADCAGKMCRECGAVNPEPHFTDGHPDDSKDAEAFYKGFRQDPSWDGVDIPDDTPGVVDGE